MKRRVNIGVALLRRPRVIYMDEPTVGIEPQSRRSILDGLIQLNVQGTTRSCEQALQAPQRPALGEPAGLGGSVTLSAAR
jgi:energy-coupling factor transporter ATP-binding protein EcfA2